MSTKAYIDQLNKLHMAKANGHVSPHKAVMLLATIDLLAGGESDNNQIRFDSELVEHFKRYFDVVKTEADSCTPINPFFYLRSEPFWHHRAKEGKEAICIAKDSHGGRKKLSTIVDHAYLDDELYGLLQSSESRLELREAIITRYFSKNYEALMQIVREEDAAGIYAQAMQGLVDGKVQKLPEVESNARDLAFARIVKRAYHYQCAACGLRVLFDGVSLVDAAHIIPFSISHDDDPRNGMSLCKNHHWAMDQELIFPCVDNKWHVHKDLDDRVDAQRSLIDLHGKSIILPEQNKYAPKQVSLEWREQLLRAGA